MSDVSCSVSVTSWRYSPNTDTLVGGMEVGVGRYGPDYVIPDQVEYPKVMPMELIRCNVPVHLDGGVVFTPRY